MKNLLIIASFALLGACQTYGTGDARHQCCSDAMANGKTCACCEDMDMNAKSMSAGTTATHTMDQCCADAAANGESCCEEMSSCDSAAATCPVAAKDNSMPKMACCAEAAAKGEVCAECAKK